MKGSSTGRAPIQVNKSTTTTIDQNPIFDRGRKARDLNFILP